jgi:hypothetical protein
MMLDGFEGAAPGAMSATIAGVEDRSMRFSSVSTVHD